MSFGGVPGTPGFWVPPHVPPPHDCSLFPTGGFGGGLGGGFGGGFGGVVVRSGYSVPPLPPEGTAPPKSRAIVIKKIETRDGKLVSESSDVLES